MNEYFVNANAFVNAIVISFLKMNEICEWVHRV